MKKKRLLKSDPNLGHTLLSEGAVSSARLPSDYSPPTLAVEGAEKYFSSQTFDVQMTVRSKFELTRKQLCLLTGVALLEVSQKGIGLSDWIILEWFYSQLLGNKQDPLERHDLKELELSLLLKVVLLSGTWMGLEGKRELPEDVRTLISKSRWVPSRRTADSWGQSYSLRKYIEVRAVPLDVLLERTKGTTRYSSYCKGYGESSRMGRRQKTRPSAELDGEPVDLEKDQVVKLDLNRIEQVLSAVLLEIKYKLQR